MSAMTVEEFSIKHKLVFDRQLDHERAKSAFDAQLGKPLRSKSSFSSHERALAAIFGLQAFCDNLPAARGLLDALNDNKGVHCPQFSITDNAFNQVMDTSQAKAWVRRHSTTRTALTALHMQDLQLPVSKFRWLKGVDRTLWYALLSTSLNAAFICISRDLI